MWTKQELLNISVAHILKQGGPAVNAEGFCVYHDKDTGKGCAAAPFLVDSTIGMSGSWNGLALNHPQDIKPEARGEPRFIAELQLAHDRAVSERTVRTDAGFLRRYKRNIRDLVGMYDGLEVPEGIES